MMTPTELTELLSEQNVPIKEFEKNERLHICTDYFQELTDDVKVKRSMHFVFDGEDWFCRYRGTRVGATEVPFQNRTEIKTTVRNIGKRQAPFQSLFPFSQMLEFAQTLCEAIKLDWSDGSGIHFEPIWGTVLHYDIQKNVEACRQLREGTRYEVTDPFVRLIHYPETGWVVKGNYLSEPAKIGGFEDHWISDRKLLELVLFLSDSQSSSEQ